MNSTAKSLSLKILLSIVMAILIQQSIAVCQISSELTYKEFKAFDLLVNENINYENDEFYNFIKRSNNQNVYWITDNYNKETSNSGYQSELSCTDEAENEMIIEDWMTREFNVKRDLKNTVDSEEEMELEDWMTDPSHWEVNSKILSRK